MAMIAHADGTYSSLNGYEPYRVGPDYVILSGYYCSFDNAEHYRTFGGSITIRHNDGGESSGIVLDSRLRYQIRAALDNAGIPHRTYSPEDQAAWRASLRNRRS